MKWHRIISVLLVLTVSFASTLTNVEAAEAPPISQEQVVELRVAEARQLAEKGTSLREMYGQFGSTGVAVYCELHNLAEPVKLAALRSNLATDYLSVYTETYGREASLQDIYTAFGSPASLVEYKSAYGRSPSLEQMWSLRDSRGKALGWRGLSLHMALFNKKPGNFHSKQSCSGYYRPYVRFIYSKKGILRERWVSYQLNSIWGESRGNPLAVSGQHKGLMQFNKKWPGGNNKFDAAWSIVRTADCIRVQGDAGWRRHWKATCYH